PQAQGGPPAREEVQGGQPGGDLPRRHPVGLGAVRPHHEAPRVLTEGDHERPRVEHELVAREPRVVEPRLLGEDAQLDQLARRAEMLQEPDAEAHGRQYTPARCKPTSAPSSLASSPTTGSSACTARSTRGPSWPR